MCQKDTCSICLENVKFFDMKINPKRRRQIKQKTLKSMGERLICGHFFHQDCIKKWFLNTETEASDNCPMCRQPVRFSNRGMMINRQLYNQKEMLNSLKEEEEQQVIYYVDEDEEMSDEEEEQLFEEVIGEEMSELDDEEMELWEGELEDDEASYQDEDDEANDQDEDDEEDEQPVQIYNDISVRQIKKIIRQEKKSIERTRFSKSHQPIRQKFQKTRKMY